MPLDPRALLFAFNCYLAAMLALGIGFVFNMPNPWWAALTVYLTSQPQNAAIGAVWGRALHRLAGTVVGMLVSLALVPLLSNTPEMLILAISAWIALCVFAGLLDRTPRAYAFYLAGFTVALVGFPAIDDPMSLWDSAVLRSEQIGLGVLCAAVVHSVILPRSIHELVRGRLAAVRADTQRWIVGALHPEPAAPADATARRKLAADLSDLNLLSRSLEFEGSHDARSRRVLRALETQWVSVLPLMISTEDRIAALRDIDALPESVRLALDRASRWIASGDVLDDVAYAGLIAEFDALAGALDAHASWTSLLVSSLAARLIELGDAWRRVLLLSAAFEGATPADGPRLVGCREVEAVRSLHRDRGLAAYSGFAAGLAALMMASLAMATNWAQGAAAMGVTAAGSSVFAFADDPSPLLKIFLKFAVLAVPVAAFYAFAVFPSIDGFALLAVALFPVLMLDGYFLASPKHWLPALAFGLFFNTLLTLQPNEQPDFVAFTSVSIAALAAVVASLFVTRLIRVIRPDVSALRILRAGWRELVDLSTGARFPGRDDWASRMLDRQALLLPRLANLASPERFRRADALKDLLVGTHLAALRGAVDGLAPPARHAIGATLEALGRHFQDLTKDEQVVPAGALLGKIDDMIVALLSDVDSVARQQAIAAGTALRRGVFPTAAAFRPIAGAS